MKRSTDPLALGVARFIKKHALIAAGDRLAVAVSGGADSVALLELLLSLRERLAIQLSVAHFNHRLRGAESDEDQRFVEQLGAERGLRLFLGCADVAAEARRRHSNLEATARALRYEYLEGLVRGGEVDRVATGHTADDQAETVVARFLRGAGMRGLAGIYPKVQSPKSKVQSLPDDSDETNLRIAASKRGVSTLDLGPRTLDSSAWLIRPLLEVRRAHLRDWLLARAPRPSNLAPGPSPLWREDASNADPRFTRNRLRAGLMPALEAYNPQLVEQLSRLAEVARDEEDYWASRLADLLPRISSIDSCSGLPVLKLRVPEFAQLTKAEQRRVVRRACLLAGFGRQLDAANVEAIRELALGGQSGRKFLISGLEVARVFGELAFAVRPRIEKSHALYEFRVSIPGSCRLPSGTLLVFKLVNRRFSDWGYNVDEEAVLDVRLAGGAVTVRNWRPGDFFDSPTGQGTRKIKTLLLRRRVPVTERQAWPVVVCGDRVAWMRGFPVAREFRPQPGSDSGVWIQELGEPGSRS